jgi:hypothetical protein
VLLCRATAKFTFFKLDKRRDYADFSAEKERKAKKTLNLFLNIRFKKEAIMPVYFKQGRRNEKVIISSCRSWHNGR